MATNPDRSSYFPAIEKKYGQPMSYWFDQMAEISDRKYAEQIAFLKEEHGFSQAHANALVMYARGSTSTVASRRSTTTSRRSTRPRRRRCARSSRPSQSKYRKAEIVIAWNQPMIKLDGQYIFGVMRAVELHPDGAVGHGVLDQFRPRLTDYTLNKKTIQVPLDWKPDVALLRDMAAARIEARHVSHDPDARRAL